MLGKTLRIAGLLLLLLPAGAQAETLLESLVWEDGVLILGFDGPYECRSMVLDNPDRIVLDFPEVRSELSVHDYSGTGALQRIRVGQNEVDEPGGERVRVVVDLAEPHNFMSESAGKYLRVLLTPGSGEDLGQQRVEGAVAEAETFASASEDLSSEDSELPIIAESAALPAPPAEETPAAPPVLAASAGGFDGMGGLPEEEPQPVAPDLSSEDQAPAEWEAPRAANWQDSVIAAFANLGGENAVQPVSEAPEAAAPPQERFAAAAPAFDEPAADAVPEDEFFGDPFEMTAESMAPTDETAAAAAPVLTHETAPTVAANAVDAEPVPDDRPAAETAAQSYVSVQALPDETPADSGASPVGMPVVMSADMSGVGGWEVSTSSAATDEAPDDTAAAAKVPVVKFSHRAPDDDEAQAVQAAAVAAAAVERQAPIAQVVDAGASVGAKVQKADTEAMRKAMMASHDRVKPDDAAITLEMRGAEFQTLLRAFSEFSGQNIVAGREVKGKVSVNLKDVPWREALQAVCASHGYGVKSEYGVLRVGPRGQMLQEEMEQLSAEKKRSEYRPLVTHVVPLSYAVALEIMDPLSKMLSDRGKMDVDDRTNSILITDLPEVANQLVELATTLDRLMPQVEITARIVDVDYSASRDLGINWQALNLVNSDAGLVGEAGVDASFPQPVGQFKMATVRDWGEINLTLQALEEQNKANIISNPRVMTMDNREANILVGKKIPLIVADEAGNAITQLTTIGIKLVVTPHINPDGQIMMHVLTEVSDLASEATVQGGVIITTSESKTNVMVGDGDTAVIAGMIRDSESKFDNEVPVLGRLPILGHLFGYSNRAESKRELIIFITPRVVNPGGETTAGDLNKLGFEHIGDG